MIFKINFAPCNTGLDNGKYAKLTGGLFIKTTPIIIRNEIFSDFLLQRFFITLENKLADKYDRLQFL